MPDLSLNDQVKAAERDKHLLEAKKVEIELKKAQFELDELIKENSKKWFLKKEFGYNISKWVVGVGFVLFFINYVIVPAANRDNIELSTKNAIANDSLYKREEALQKETLILNLEKDSLKIFSIKLNAIRKQFNVARMQLEEISESLGARTVSPKNKDKLKLLDHILGKTNVPISSGPAF